VPTLVTPINLDLIDDDPRNPRGPVGDVTALKLSIAQDGQQNPIQVIPQGNGRYWLHEGHRRKKALTELGAKTAQAVECRYDTDLDRLVSQAVQHAHACDWDPMAWARYLYRLFSEHNLDRYQIAHRIAKSPNWVRDTLSFTHLTGEEQRQLAAGAMTRAEALRRLADRRAVRDGRPAPATRPAVPQQRSGGREPHLNNDHRLAGQVTARCAAAGPSHAARPRIGTVGCGACWEAVIAADAVTRATRPALASAA
jgi:ParB/RepB/Spo0J family partition protein